MYNKTKDTQAFTPSPLTFVKLIIQAFTTYPNPWEELFQEHPILRPGVRQQRNKQIIC